MSPQVFGVLRSSFFFCSRQMVLFPIPHFVTDLRGSTYLPTLRTGELLFFFLLPKGCPLSPPYSDVYEGVLRRSWFMLARFKRLSSHQPPLADVICFYLICRRYPSLFIPGFSDASFLKPA